MKELELHGFRRHGPHCKRHPVGTKTAFPTTDKQRRNDCDCPISVWGYLKHETKLDRHGRTVPREVNFALKQRVNGKDVSVTNLDIAKEMMKRIELDGHQPGKRTEDVDMDSGPDPDKAETVTEAVNMFLELEVGSRAYNTFRHYRTILTLRLLPWCKKHHKVPVSVLKNKVFCTRFIQSWKMLRAQRTSSTDPTRKEVGEELGVTTLRDMIMKFWTFVEYCKTNGWIEENGVDGYPIPEPPQYFVDKDGKLIEIARHGLSLVEFDRLLHVPLPKRYRETERGIATVKRIMELRDQGLGIVPISDMLNKEKITNQYGRVWHPGTVYNVLQAGTIHARRSDINGTSTMMSEQREAEARAGIAVMARCGPRPVDCWALTKQNIQPNESSPGWHLDFFQKKLRHRQNVRCQPPLPDWVRDMLLSLPGIENRDNFFTTTESQFSDDVQALGNFANAIVPFEYRFTPYTLRHTFFIQLIHAMYAGEARINMAMIAEWGGHKNENTTRKYYAAAIKETLQVLAKAGNDVSRWMEEETRLHLAANDVSKWMEDQTKRKLAEGGKTGLLESKPTSEPITITPKAPVTPKAPIAIMPRAPITPKAPIPITPRDRLHTRSAESMQAAWTNGYRNPVTKAKAAATRRQIKPGKMADDIRKRLAAEEPQYLIAAELGLSRATMSNFVNGKEGYTEANGY
jgi:hypothetical protein